MLPHDPSPSEVWPCFPLAGEMAALVRTHDWSATPLGPIDSWPQSLKTAVDLMLGSRQPVYIAWGPELTSIYNDAYIPIVGAKHPAGLGQPFNELWSEIREEYRPLVEAVLAGGAQHFVDRPAALAGRDGLGVGYFTFSWTPLRDEAGVIRGFFCNGLETTERVEAGLAFRRMFEASPTPFLVLATDAPRFTILEVNDAYLAAVLRTREDLLGLGVFEAMPDNPKFDGADGVANLRASIERAIASKRPDTMPRQRYDIPHPNGGFEERWWDPVNSPLLGADGRVEAIIHHVVDVTERQTAEERERQSEAKLRAVIEEAPLAMVLTGTSGEILFRNPRFDQLWGRPPHVTTARTYSEVYEGYHLDGRPIASEEWPGARALFKGEVVENDVYEIVQASGQRITCWFGGAPIRDASGEIAGAVVVFRDVSKERQTESRLSESKARYRTLFENIDAGFCVVEVDLAASGGRIDYRVIEANPAFYRQTGFPEAILGQWLREAAPDLEEHWYETYGRVAQLGKPERFEQGSGHLGRWFDVHAFRVGEADERRVAILFNDISARRNAEERLRQLNETLETQVAERTAERDRMWETSPDLMLIMGFDGYFRRVNPAWTDVLGYAPEELVGHHVNEFVLPEDHEDTSTAVRMAAEGSKPRIENRYRHKDGSVRWISWTAAPAGKMGYATGRDVTAEKQRQAELEQAQEALRQSQKLESMGQLTGGVAHDFNNLLTPIIGSLDMLQRRGMGSEREQRLIAGAAQSAERAKTLVQRLLAFARRQPLQPIPVDLRKLVEGMAELVASTSGPRVKVELDIAPEVPAVTADPNQLEMAILNLAVNSRDAMPDGGALTITAKPKAVEEGHRSGLAPGNYVRLSVSDTGTGMDAETTRRAIEPFFSTKGVGKGTGLGLSMVHGLVAQLRGSMTIKSRHGVGTIIELWLPVATGSVLPSEKIDKAVEAAVAGTALLVDDEELVRASTADMLSDLGYSVSEASSAEEALRLLEDGLGPDVVITDHLMPGMTGTDLAYVLKAREPSPKILIISGYADDDGIAPDLPRLTKPFRQADLASSLAELSDIAIASGG